MTFPSDKIYLDKSLVAGRGVFAKQAIKKGEVIEIAPILVIPPEQSYDLCRDLYRFVFDWGVEGKKTVALAMGFGSFYNHSDDPNAVYERSLFSRELRFTTIKDIKSGEEIFINYGYKIAEKDVRKL